MTFRPEPRYLTGPASILRLDLPGGLLRVYLAILAAGGGGPVEISNDDLSRLLGGVGKTSASRAVIGLEARGLIRCHYNAARTRRQWIEPVLAAPDEVSAGAYQTPGEVSAGADQTAAQVSAGAYQGPEVSAGAYPVSAGAYPVSAGAYLGHPPGARSPVEEPAPARLARELRNPRVAVVVTDSRANDVDLDGGMQAGSDGDLTLDDLAAWAGHFVPAGQPLHGGRGLRFNLGTLAEMSGASPQWIQWVLMRCSIKADIVDWGSYAMSVLRIWVAQGGPDAEALTSIAEPDETDVSAPAPKTMPAARRYVPAETKAAKLKRVGDLALEMFMQDLRAGAANGRAQEAEDD